MVEKKSEIVGIRLPKNLLEKLDLYVRLYDKEYCRPRNLYTDRSKIIRALLVTFLMKKGLVGLEYEELTDPCFSEYSRE
ncbi:MAG: ribbon-helix-helix domain-containing protein [Desulfurococcaceae archaeon]